MSERFDTFGVPRPSQAELDFAAGAPGAATDDETDELDPEAAARLLAQSRANAERGLDLQPPLLAVAAAVVMLVAYGAVWVSVRHQHPYVGPTGHALAVLYGVLTVWIVLVVVTLGRGLRGVGGRSAQRRRSEGLTFAAIWISIYVVQGALYHAGASHGIAYGIWPAAAPLVVVGGAAAAYAVGQERSPLLGLVGVALGAGACFAGPAGVWGVIAVGGCAAMLVWAVVLFRRRRV